VPLPRLLRRLRILFGRRAFERDLDDELRFHMDMMASTHAASGHSATAVRSLTHKGFGSMAQYREEVRDARGLTTFDDFSRDARLAFRTLRRTPGFTMIALIAFALGIGANTAIFSVVNAVLLRPLPYPNADRLVLVNEMIKGQPEIGAVSVMNFLDWRQQARSFEAVGAYYSTSALLQGENEPQRLRATPVSANVFPMLGVQPLAGRFFTADEEIRGKPSSPFSAPGSGERASTPILASSGGRSRSTAGRTPSSASCPTASSFPPALR